MLRWMGSFHPQLKIARDWRTCFKRAPTCKSSDHMTFNSCVCIADITKHWHTVYSCTKLEKK